MIRKVPKPISGGLILSYICPAECRHCMYACSPKWQPNWMSEKDLETILSQLAGNILPAPHGPHATSLNYGLHFTGGEPFANFPLLCKAVEIAEELKIPSTFVETNCFWCKEDHQTLDRLKLLRDKGMKGILISVNPFYLEYVPFERTERAIRLSLEVFEKNTMVYQAEYYHRFKQWRLRDRVAFGDYWRFESEEFFTRNVEFFVMGRAPYKLKDLLKVSHTTRKASSFFQEPCMMPFLRPLHNHFDNYGNYVPGFCAGISLGDCRKLDELLLQGVDTDAVPALRYLMDEDIEGLLRFARKLGYQEAEEGYFSKCHLCVDIRKHLALHGDFAELSPRQFYLRLND